MFTNPELVCEILKSPSTMESDQRLTEQMDILETPIDKTSTDGCRHFQMRTLLSRELSKNIKLGMEEVVKVMDFSEKVMDSKDESKTGNFKKWAAKNPKRNPFWDINREIAIESKDIERVGKFSPWKVKLVDSLLLILPLDRLVSHLNEQMRIVKKIKKGNEILRRLNDYESICQQWRAFHEYSSFENVKKEINGKPFVDNPFLFFFVNY